MLQTPPKAAGVGIEAYESHALASVVIKFKGSVLKSSSVNALYKS